MSSIYTWIIIILVILIVIVVVYLLTLSSKKRDESFDEEVLEPEIVSEDYEARETDSGPIDIEMSEIPDSTMGTVSTPTPVVSSTPAPEITLDMAAIGKDESGVTLPPEVEEIKDELRISIKRAIAKRIPVDRAKQLYDMGIQEALRGNIAGADAYFREGMVTLQAIETQYERVRDLLKTKWERIMALKETGVNTTQAENYFAKAREAFKNGDLVTAERYIITAVQLANMEAKASSSKATDITGDLDTRNYYEILGVPPTATRKEIKRAYAKLMQQYHPDKVNTLGEKLRKVAEEEAKKINAAYEVLKDPDRRKEYDIKMGFITPEEAENDPRYD